jgi:YfiH family protein
VRAAAPPVESPPFRWQEDDGLAWIEAELPGAVAVFSTRTGGVSGGPYSSLNLGILTDDDAANVAANRARLATALARDPARFAMGLQVHGDGIEVHAEPPRRSAYAERAADLREADAQLTSAAEATPLVLVADCVPLVLAAPGAVGAVHCGWRGVAAGIVARAVASACELSGGQPRDVAAALGPGIGPCCYEVGAEVAAIFRGRGLAGALGEATLDLAAAVTIELERAGLARESIASVGLCTSCHPELFFSHRRDGGVSGRQAGLAWLSSR